MTADPTGTAPPRTGGGRPAPSPTRGEAVTAKGARSRAALIRAARVVFERDGIVDVKPADISAAAGVSRATFYTYFADREDVLRAVLHEADDPVAAARDDAGEELRAGDGPRTVAAWIESRHRAYLDSYARNAKLMLLLEQASLVYPAYRDLRIRRGEEFVGRNARWIARLQRAGLADPALDPSLTSRALSAMVSRLAQFHFTLGSEAATVDQLVAISTHVWITTLDIESDRRKHLT